MNNVTLIGRTTSEPILKYLPGGGQAVANVTIAVDKKLSNDKKAEFQQKGKDTANFLRLVIWGKSAENFTNLVGKGKMVGVQGSIETSNRDKEGGGKEYFTDILVNSFDVIEWKDKKDEGYEKEFEAVDSESDIPF